MDIYIYQHQFDSSRNPKGFCFCRFCSKQKLDYYIIVLVGRKNVGFPSPGIKRVFKVPETCRIRMFDKGDVSHFFSIWDVCCHHFVSPCCKVRKNRGQKPQSQKFKALWKSHVLYLPAPRNTTSRKHPKIFHYKNLLSNFWAHNGNA